MQFYIRQSSTFIMNIIMIALSLFMAIISLAYFWNESGFLHYFFILWLIPGGVRYAVYGKYIRLAINKQPVLGITDQYIADLAVGSTYYYSDIKELYVENLYLYISVKE